MVAQIPYAYSPNSLVLMKHWDEPFNKYKWEIMISRISFHKLSIWPEKKTYENQDGYYYDILRINGAKTI